MPKRHKKAPEKAQNERITELIARFAPASPLREAACVSLAARRRQKMAKTGVFGQTLDNDGDADVVMCSFNDDKVFGFLNDGNGNFSPIIIDASIDGPREVEIADFDNDGHKDIAVVATQPSNTLAVYLNDGSTSFSKQVLFSGKAGNDIEIGDWDGDGNVDIFISLYASPATAPLQDVIGFYNDGNANFTSDPLLVGAEKGLGIRLGDLDNDGDPDLVLGFDGNSQLYVVSDRKRQAAVHLADYQAKARAKIKALAFKNRRIIRIFEKAQCVQHCFSIE